MTTKPTNDPSNFDPDPDSRILEEPTSGVCCSCGYKGKFETPCFAREDGVHCDHWWDGTEGETADDYDDLGNLLHRTLH